MLTAHKHEMGVRLYQAGRFQEACKVLGEALGEGVTSELANDWGAAELACGHADRAEQGFVRALKLDATNAEAAENLGVLLGGLGRVAEAICVLEQGVSRASMGNQARLSALLAEYRNRYPSQGRSEAEAVMHSAIADAGSVCAMPSGPESAIAARLPSKIEKRSTDDCLVYKPDFAHVTYHAAELRGGSWSRREDHVVGMGSGASLRWRAVASRIYALLAHFPWGGKVAVSVNGNLHDIVDLYSHGKYTEPVEVFRAESALPIEVELRIVGRNALSQSDQMASFGFLVNREKSSEPPRVETDDGFVAVQKQQLVNWLESIKRRGLTLEEVTEQRKSAYTLRVSEAMAFMRRRRTGIRRRLRICVQGNPEGGHPGSRNRLLAARHRSRGVRLKSLAIHGVSHGRGPRFLRRQHQSSVS